MKRVAPKTAAKAKVTKRKPRDAVPKGKGNASPNQRGLTKFQKGDPNLGRKPGSKNKLGIKLKEAILEAAERSGSNGKGKGGTVGYLVWLSRAEPAVYGRMLEKVMPLQVEVKDKTDRALTPEEAVQRLQERGLPVPPSLSELAGKIGQAVQVRRDADEDAEFDSPTAEDFNSPTADPSILQIDADDEFTEAPAYSETAFSDGMPVDESDDPIEAAFTDDEDAHDDEPVDQ